MLFRSLREQFHLCVKSVRLGRSFVASVLFTFRIVRGDGVVELDFELALLDASQAAQRGAFFEFDAVDVDRVIGAVDRLGIYENIDVSLPLSKPRTLSSSAASLVIFIFLTSLYARRVLRFV